MANNPTLITKATAEPVSVSELKTHLRIEHTDDDTYLPLLITAARDAAERYTARVFMPSTWEYRITDFPGIDGVILPLGPAQSVESIKYYDLEQSDTTLASSVYEAVQEEEATVIKLAYNQSWPNYTQVPLGIRIQYVAGFPSITATPAGNHHGHGHATALSTVPDAIRMAIMMDAGLMYKYRESVMDMATHEVPRSARRLLDAYKIVKVA